jgi:hypothetical protein
MMTEVCRVPCWVPFYPDAIRTHLLIGCLAGGILKHFPHMLCQNLWGYFLLSFLSWVLGSAVFPTRLNLFLQRLDSMGQPMGGYARTGQTFIFHKIDLVDQSYHMRGFKWSRLFTPSTLEFGKSVDEGGEAEFMVPAIEPCIVPSPGRRL